MKRIDLVRHLSAHGCQLLREGGRHSIFWNPANRKTSAVPRHAEIVDPVANRICDEPALVIDAVRRVVAKSTNR